MQDSLLERECDKYIELFEKIGLDQEEAIILSNTLMTIRHPEKWVPCWEQNPPTCYVRLPKRG